MGAAQRLRFTLIAIPMMLPKATPLLILLLAFLAAGCGHDTLHASATRIDASWPALLSEYQRRADLARELADKVERVTPHEAEVVAGVIESRATARHAQVAAVVIRSPDTLQRFDAAQDELSRALSLLMRVAENSPQLRSDVDFRALQGQLERTENRIAFARERYIRAVDAYNAALRAFPSDVMTAAFAYRTMPNLTRRLEVDKGAAQHAQTVSSPLHESGGRNGISK